MTPDILIVLGILLGAIILFITEWVRMDLVALLVLVSLVLSGLVSTDDALAGFSNTAVITVWAILILSNALSRTGVASLIGSRIQKLGGSGEVKLLFVIMLTAGILSGFMNSIGVASLFLPVVIEIAHRTNRPPSKLLMPLAYSALLGGLITLIGTPPNLLISDALRSAGLRPFAMFDFTPVGIFVMLGGLVFIAFVGYRMLPERDISKELGPRRGQDSTQFFGLQERMCVIQIPFDSALANKSLAESKLGAALGLNVIAILRNTKSPDERTQLAPDPNTILLPGDRLLVEGRLERLFEFHGRDHLIVEDRDLTIEQLTSTEVQLFEMRFSEKSEFHGKNLRQINFRQKFGLLALALRRGPDSWRTGLARIPLQAGDILLVQGSQEQVDALKEYDESCTFTPVDTEIYHLEEHLMMLRILADSALTGKSLIESRLGEAFGLRVMGIVRQDQLTLMPDPEDVLVAGDVLLVKGRREDLLTVQGLQDLQIESQGISSVESLESDRVGLVVALLSPYTTLAGKSLRELHFRAKYGINVLAIWREGRAFRSNLAEIPLKFGDALLLYGPREKLRVLGSDPDFLVLSEEAQETPRYKKAPIALLIMAAVLIPVIFGWLHIAIAAIMGVVLMVLTRCITMEEAYRSIELKAIFLIAGMLPLGIAMQQTGAAQLLAEAMIGLIGGFGGMAVMAGLFILAALASQVMPNPAVAVLLAPIALNTASQIDISPYPLMMAVAVSASAAFLSPVGHPANVLVMGPGGYKFSDYTKIGLPLTLVVLIISMIVIPLFWPL